MKLCLQCNAYHCGRRDDCMHCADPGVCLIVLGSALMVLGGKGFELFHTWLVARMLPWVPQVQVEHCAELAFGCWYPSARCTYKCHGNCSDGARLYGWCLPRLRLHGQTKVAFLSGLLLPLFR